MPRLLKSCKKHFGTENLYEVLGISKEASQAVVKRAYYRKSLDVHPDRVEEDERAEATKQFQVLAQAYAVLSNADSRKVYDETGEVDEESTVPPDRDWQAYWRLLYNKVSVQDIEEFEERYKGSAEERTDLLEAYVSCKGDLDTIMETVLCATYDDEERFTKMLKEAIKAEEVPDLKAFTKESKAKKAARKRRALSEAEEAEEAAGELGLDGTDAGLRAAIMQRASNRQQEMDGFFASLEAKYGGSPGKKRKSSKKKA